MTKAELINQIYRQTHCTEAEVAVMINALFDVIKDSLTQRETIYIRGFGNFQTRYRSQRTARNIKRNTLVDIAPHYFPMFKPSSLFKDELNKKTAP